MLENGSATNKHVTKEIQLRQPCQVDIKPNFV